MCRGPNVLALPSPTKWPQFATGLWHAIPDDNNIQCRPAGLQSCHEVLQIFFEQIAINKHHDRPGAASDLQPDHAIVHALNYAMKLGGIKIDYVGRVIIVQDGETYTV